MTDRESGNPPAQKTATWFQRLFAAALATESKTHQQYYEARKRELIGGVSGDVLEIGPGTGPNLKYYSHNVRWIGLEPNPAMWPYAQQEAQRLGLSVRLRDGHIETLDMPENSFDAVVATLVLCSVRDQQSALHNILRVLKPGGRFVFIEHVAAPNQSRLRFLQRIIAPVWKLFGEGCRPDRETWIAIEHAGFKVLELNHFRVPVPIVETHIAGVAIK